ncbi:group II intron reverse transcriptase/maturase [Novipirellula artificiosorum]|uniref:Group II intron-encoded protein LtrA n=1 Tax=Novipirellula artificiosorum TaxID=2528016 RepID=A0A5C6D5U8_9BACT|nr:group II intron reverse transcriptase/maturase [Novipirellula artificiosorum]TWU31111.1 Group II intron-encoded protein LtrA [Novipirellula artificiosorum]
MNERLDRITTRAKGDAAATFNNVFTLLNNELLFYAFRRLKRDKAPGVDGVTVDDYEVKLQENLQSLEDRLHRGSYRPQPSLRREIPKSGGKTRPLGIACVEEKIVQRAIVMILERIYEVDFCDTSYGYRPGRSCHQALADLGQIIVRERVNFVYDADIAGFFDNVCHEKLVELLGHRLKDQRLLRLITKFLKSGVTIQGTRHDTTKGIAQGSVLSPLLANVYLHYVLDEWFEQQVKPRLTGQASIIRFADDFVCTFERESDAKRFAEVLSRRLGRYSLQLAEAKTKLIRFGRFARRDCQRLGEGAPGTFDFLGFMHYCGTSRSGKFKLKRRTSAKKFGAKVGELKDWFRTQLTTPISIVWPTLVRKLQGHFQYFNVNDNWEMLMKYQEAARRLGLRWMRRRSQKGRDLSWEAYERYLKQHPLPNPGQITDLIAMTRSK